MSTHDIELAKQIAFKSEKERFVYLTAMHTGSRDVMFAKHDMKISADALKKLTHYPADTVNKDLEDNLKTEKAHLAAFSPEDKARCILLTEQIRAMQKELDPLAQKRQRAQIAAQNIAKIEKTTATLKDPEGERLVKECQARAQATLQAEARLATAEAAHKAFKNARDTDITAFLKAEKKVQHFNFRESERKRPMSARCDTDRSYMGDSYGKNEEEFQQEKKDAEEAYAAAAAVVAKKSRTA